VRLYELESTFIDNSKSIAEDVRTSVPSYCITPRNEETARDKNTRPEGKCFISIPRERFLISDVFNLVGLFFFKKIKKEII
jgi:hypothetical protein